MLENKLGITDRLELKRQEEKLSKLKAKELFDSGLINAIEVGTYKGLQAIHQYIFEEIYNFAGKTRHVNISKDNFRFAPIMYLEGALEHINKMPQHSFDEIVEKYVEMNIAHPFREGNGRTMRIWLDLMLKQELGKVVDWSKIDKEDYLLAMQRSPIRTIEIKHVLREALTNDIYNRDLYMNGIDYSYYYEGQEEFRTIELE